MHAGLIDSKSNGTSKPNLKERKKKYSLYTDENFREEKPHFLYPL